MQLNIESCKCGKPMHSKGLCSTCYQRMRRTGPTYKAAHVKRNWQSRIMRKFGLTLLDYNKMRDEQHGKCKICGVVPFKTMKNLSVDHCHKTGEVRGLLCVKCNAALGWYEKYQTSVKAYLSGKAQ